jgi:hypothetical protein
VAPAPKLFDREVKRIRRRIHAGEHLTDLAREFGVNRKTIRRRLDALQRAETESAERRAATQIRRQATHEKAKLLEREKHSWPAASVDQNERSERVGRQRRESDPYLEWLDTPKNLSGRARAEATGLVRVHSSDNTRRVWVERSEVEALLDGGWRLAD